MEVIEVLSIEPIDGVVENVVHAEPIFTPFQKSYERRANSIAFTPVLHPKTEEPMFTPAGLPLYKCVKVPLKKGHLFCTECHEYQKFDNIPSKMGTLEVRCPVCHISIQDFYIRTANGLWGTGSKSRGDE